MSDPTSNKLRLQIACLTAFAGGASALSLYLTVPDIARHAPPPEVFLRAAVIGAGAAGFLCAPMIGRPGAGGWILAAVWAVTVTLLGAELGSAAAQTWMDPRVMWSGPGFGLGVLTVGYLGSSAMCAALWVGAMMATHLRVHHLRAFEDQSA